MKTSYSQTVPDHVVRAAIARAQVMLRDGIVPVEAQFQRWVRTSTGQLAALCVNRLTGVKVIVGLDNRSGKVRPLARA